jgi:WD40 repeat protein
MPYAEKVASGSHDKKVIMWEAGTGSVLAVMRGQEKWLKKKIVLDGHTGIITCLTFTPNGHRLLSGSGDKTIRLWNSSDGAFLTSLEGHAKEITSIACCSDSRRVVSGSADKTLKIWVSARSIRLASWYKSYAYVYVVR